MNDAPLHPRQGQLLLAALLLFFAAWDMRAVLADRRLSPTDSTVEDALLLQQALGQDGLGLGAWLRDIRKGPLAGPVVALADVAVGDPVLAGRLVNVALKGVVLWLVCLITVRLTASWGAGLCAAVICGTFPMVYGWFRLDYHEPLVAALLLWCLRLMLSTLRRPREAALLGLALGLGLLAKLSFAVFISAPLVILAIQLLRRQGGPRFLGLVAGICVLVTGWWLLPNAAHLLSYLGQSHQRVSETPVTRLVIYTWGVHGSALLLGFAALGAAAAWRLGVTSGRALLLLAGSLAGGLAWLVLLFDSWPRYLVPGFPVAAILCGLGLAGAGRLAAPRLGARLIKVAAGGCLAALLLNFCVDNLRGLRPSLKEREGGAGMVKADRRTYEAYPRAVAALGRLSGPSLELPGWRRMLGKRPVALSLVWQRRGLTLPRATVARLAEHLSQGQTVHLVFCHTTGGDVLAQLARVRVSDHVDAATLALLLPKKKRVLQTFSDPGGVSFSLIRVEALTDM